MQRVWQKSCRQSRRAPAFVRRRILLKRRLRARAARHRRPGPDGWMWFADYADDLAFEQRIMARALRQFLHAPDGFAACGVLVLNPILLMESACERLARAIAKAEARGDEKNRELLKHYLVMLELARQGGVIAVMRKLTQKE